MITGARMVHATRVFLLALLYLPLIGQLTAKELWIDYEPKKILYGEGGASYREPKTRFKIYVYGSPLKYTPLGVIVHRGSFVDAFRSEEGLLRDMIALAKRYNADALIIIEKNKPLVFAVAGFWPAMALPTAGGSFMALAVKESRPAIQNFSPEANRQKRK